jgi:hypothetical protein
MHAYFCDGCGDWAPIAGRNRCAACGEYLAEASTKLLKTEGKGAQRILAASFESISSSPRSPSAVGPSGHRKSTGQPSDARHSLT